MTVLVLDVGGSAIKYALMNENYEILEKGKIDERLKTEKRFVEELKKLKAKYPDADGIAMSYCGELNPVTGEIKNPGSYSFFEDQNLKEVLESRLKTRVWIEKDAACAGLAEVHFGALQDAENCAALIFGTGLGCAIMHNKKVYYGTHYKSSLATCVSTSIRAFSPKFRKDDFLRAWNRKVRHQKKPQGIDGFKFFQQVEKGNPLALWRLKFFTRQIARFIVDMQMMLDLDTIAIGGGVSAQERFIREIKLAVDHEVEGFWAKAARLTKPEIRVCQFNNDANLMGALYHYLDMEKKK